MFYLIVVFRLKNMIQEKVCYHRRRFGQDDPSHNLIYDDLDIIKYTKGEHIMLEDTQFSTNFLNNNVRNSGRTIRAVIMQIKYK